MAKTTIKTYFTGGTGLDNIIRVDGSAEQCQKYVKGITRLDYSGLIVTAGKKAISHVIKLHLGTSNEKYGNRFIFFADARCPFNGVPAACPASAIFRIVVAEIV